MKNFFTPLAAALFLLALTACHAPCPCASKAQDYPAKCGYLAHFHREPPRASIAPWPVLQSRKKLGPPVVLLPELPAVSSSLLDLGERLEEAGYTVYIPVLWGSEWDDATQKGLTNKRAFSLSFDPRFKGLCGSADRPAVHEVARFCRYLMGGPHRGQHLGMIGNCLTGNFPIAVAAEVPELVAPILSQPAIPFFDPSHPGLTRAQITALKARTHDTAHPPLQIVGFRFAGDQVSPEPRFQTYQNLFCDSFLPYVIPTRLYVDQDQLPLHAHTVLTGCYLNGSKPSTAFAWSETKRFLDTKLHHPSPHHFQPRPFPLPHTGT